MLQRFFGMFCSFRRIPFLSLFHGHLQMLDALCNVWFRLFFLGLLGFLHSSFGFFLRSPAFPAFPSAIASLVCLTAWVSCDSFACFLLPSCFSSAAQATPPTENVSAPSINTAIASFC